MRVMFLAFLIDQAQQRCCGLFQAALKKNCILEQIAGSISRILRRFLGRYIYMDN